MIRAKYNSMGLYILAACLGVANSAYSSEINDTAKKATRKIKDETCEIFDGKVKCVAKKIQHKAENLKDSVKDKTQEVK
jgi:uncharacterized protein YjbJ (UPF0337 family)